MARSKQEWVELRAKAAKDLGLAEAKDQQAHLLLVSREYKAAVAEHGEDWGKVHAHMRGIGHGFGMNASQFNQWLDKAEGGVKAEVLADLDV